LSARETTRRVRTDPGGLVAVDVDERVGQLELGQNDGRKSVHAPDDELLERHDAGGEELRKNTGQTLYIYTPIAV